MSWLPQYHDLGLTGSILLGFFVGNGLVGMSPLTFLKDPNLYLNAVSHFKGFMGAFPNFGSVLCTHFLENWHVLLFAVRLELMCRKFLPSRVDPDFSLSSVGVWTSCAEPVRHSTLTKFVEKFTPFGFAPSAMRPGVLLFPFPLIISMGSFCFCSVFFSPAFGLAESVVCFAFISVAFSFLCQLFLFVPLCTQGLCCL